MRGPMKCEIQWIDDSGQPTPDDNPAIGFARLRASEYVGANAAHGRVAIERRSYPICAEHAARMAEPDMECWELELFI